MIRLSDKLYFFLSAHILYLFFPYNCTVAVFTKFIIDKLVQKVFGRKAVLIEVVLMLIDSSYEIVCYSYIKSRSGISHNIHCKTSLHKSLYQKDSRQAGMTPTQIPEDP
jgi:hypothetical protein